MRVHAAAVVVVPIVALLSGCGGADGSEMRATLANDGCAYEGDTDLDAGRFSVVIENETEYLGAFAIAALSGGSTVETLEPYLADAQTTFDEQGTLPDPPAYYEQVVRAAIEPGTTGSLPVDVPAGTYALMCFVDDLPQWRAYAAAQIAVTG